MFWVDERVVPKDHADSNYKLAMDGLLSKVATHLDYPFLFGCHIIVTHNPFRWLGNWVAVA